jgi:hypothetical protein
MTSYDQRPGTNNSFDTDFECCVGGTP